MLPTTKTRQNRNTHIFSNNLHRFFQCLLLGMASLIIAPNTRANDVTYGQYDEFTLYNADGGPLKDDIMFVFHGFGSAMPNGAYKRLYDAYSGQFSVIGFNYDYFDLAGNDEAMERVWTQVLAGRNVIFGGTSLGGFWANYYAEKYGVDRVLLANPVVDPVNQLRQFIGRHYVEKRNKDLIVTQAKVDGYKGRNSAAEPGISRLVILSRDDEILDYRLAEKKFIGPQDTIAVFDDGGHTLDLSQERYLDIIGAFLSSEN